MGTFIGQGKLPINKFKGGLNFRNIILFSGLILLLTIVLAGPASAATIPVTPGSDAIKNAINTASDGDTLDLSAGTYNEHDIVVNKNLTITGPKTTNHNPPTAVVDAQKLGRVFMINSGLNVTLQYLIIQNSNQPLSGGGVYNEGNLTINNCTLQRNSATHNGGAVNNGDNGILTITDSYITQNIAESGGGISNGHNKIVIINSNLEGNHAGVSGGGIYSWGGHVTMIRSSISFSSANQYGGGIQCRFGDLIVKDSNISYCGATHGGGINAGWATVTISGTNMYVNRATEGGGIYENDYVTNISLNNCKIYRNEAKYGAAIYNIDKVSLSNSNIYYNTATYGGGIYNGVFEEYDYGKMYGKSTLTNSNVYNNIGSGIYNDGKGCEVTLAHSNLYNNTASNGGGINNFNGKITLLNSNIYSNTATKGSGGGIYTNHPAAVTLTNSNVYNNIAIQGNGGGIDNEYRSVLTLINSGIYNNRAPLGIGGGIYNTNYASTIMSNSNLSRNTAKYGGGLGNSVYGKTYLTFCRIVGNNAQYGRDIYNSMVKYRGTVTAKLNWWGSNSNPVSKVQGTVNMTPWLILTLTANPVQVELGRISNIKALLIRDSNGIFHNPANGHVPDGIQIKFKTTLGTLNSPVSTTNGVANTILNSGTVNGVADVSAAVDSQTVHIPVTIGPIPPRVVQIDPGKYAVNVSPYKVIKVTFSKPVKAGNMWIELKNSIGKVVPVTTGISTNILAIKPNSPLINGKYNLIMHTGSLTDLANNPIALYTSTFTVYKALPTVKSVNPVKNAVNVPTNKLIRVTFTVPVKIGNGWIELKNSGGKSIPITYSTINDVLTINHTSLLSKATKYVIILHTGSVTDLIGNPVTSYTSYFTTA